MRKLRRLVGAALAVLLAETIAFFRR